MYTIRWNKARGQSWVAKVVGEGRTWPFFCRVFLYAKVWYSLEAHHFALRRDSENTSERVIRRLVHAPGMPAAYQFTRCDEQSRHNYTFATDSETGGLVMTAPNGAGHEGARLYGGGEGPEHWLKVRPLDSPRANTGRCATPTKTARAPSRPPRAAGCATTRSTAPGTTPRERRGHAARREGGPPQRQRLGATASGRPTAAPTTRPGGDATTASTTRRRRRHDRHRGGNERGRRGARGAGD